MLRYLYLLMEGGVYRYVISISLKVIHTKFNSYAWHSPVISTPTLVPILEWAKGAVDWPSGKVPMQPV